MPRAREGAARPRQYDCPSHLLGARDEMHGLGVAHSVLLIGAALLAAAPGLAPPVVIISVDGLKPEYVIDAGSRGRRIPYLRSFVADGTTPTVTYPSHATLVTGVSPVEHGIFANLLDSF